MQCVILAAGEGVRMRPLTLTTPKPMLKVLGKTLLEHTIDSLPAEVDELIIVVGYLGDQIREYFKHSYGGRRITYVHQPKKLGTYDALAMAEPFLKEGFFLVLYADDLFGPITYQRLVDAKSFAIVVQEVPNPERFGVVTLRPDGTVKEIEEKPEYPKSNLANCGPTALSKEIFKHPAPLHAKGEYFLTDSVAELALHHPVKVVRADWWMPIGYPEDLAKAEEFLKNVE
jgi:bifunctional UDP-N-acetylglucosamine pyrophosphorylase/glucosamine-1-phosphate N-acetyltransferase